MLTFLSCLIFNLNIAFFIGIIISIASYLKRAAIPHVVEYAFDPKGKGILEQITSQFKNQIKITKNNKRQN